jgi:hypothetical protein
MREDGRSWGLRCATGIVVFVLALGGARGAAAQGGSPLFQETARLTPAGAAGLELRSATLSGDGNRALLGFGGVAFVFVRTAGGWIEEARLDPPDGAPDQPLGGILQSFGSAVALSGDGSTASVGGEAECASTPSGFCQAAWVFARSGGTWNEQAALPIDHEWGPGNSRRFIDLSADGATALIGAPFCGAACINALVFIRSGETWSVEGALEVPGDSEGAAGAAVALSDDGALALLGPADFQTHVFARTGGTWSAVQVLQPDLGSPDRIVQDFGAALDLSSDGAVALIGAPRTLCGGFELGSPCGSAFFFRRSGGLYTNVQAFEDGDDFESTGSSVALSGNGSLALITQPGAGALEGGVVGATKVLVAAGGAWTEVQELGVGGPSDFLLHGGVAALSRAGDTALVANVVFEQASVVTIPTASDFGLVLLALLVAASGAALLARRRRTA